MRIDHEPKVLSPAPSLLQVQAQEPVINDSCDRKLLHQKVAQDPVSILSTDHANYCLAVKKQINPKSEDFKLVYGASGPDLSVPLLSSNATEILCLEKNKLDLNKLNEAFSKGSKALYSTRYFPLDLHCGLGYSPDRPQVFLESALEARAKNGYWLASNINNLGFERCLLIELDKLGIDFQEIKISSDNDGLISIGFPWAFPGEVKKMRKISFKTAQLPEVLDSIDFSKVNAYLQKSGMTAQNKKVMRASVANILKSAKPGFFVMSGKLLERREAAHVKTASDYFGDQVENKMQDLVVEIPKIPLGSYGQQMLLAQVI
jgi:hypothetical protein